MTANTTASPLTPLATPSPPPSSPCNPPPHPALPPPPLPQRSLSLPPSPTVTPSPSIPNPPKSPPTRRAEVMSFLIHGTHADIAPTSYKAISEFRFAGARAAFLRDEVVSQLPGRTLISLKGLMEEGRKGLWEGWADRMIGFQQKVQREGEVKAGRERLREGEPRLWYFFFDNGDVIGVLFQLRSSNPELLMEAEGQSAEKGRWWQGGCCPLLSHDK